MFLHVYKYRLKTIFRSRVDLFWILLFPLLLGTCFYTAFHNLTKSLEEFNTIPVAIVCEDDADLTFFKAYIDALSSEENNILSATYTTSDEAQSLLSDKKITGIITFKDSIPSLTFLNTDSTNTSVSQSILKELMDSYIQSLDILSNVEPEDTESLMAVIANLGQNADYIIERKLTDGNTDYMLDYYFSLIAMTCLFGSYSGHSCANFLKANLSAQGMRKCLSSTKRLTLILGDFFASCTFPVISNIILIIYLNYILKINLGGNVLLIILTAAIGSIIGVSIGLFIGAIPGMKDSLKNGIMTASSLFLSFLSGLMVGGIKYKIEKVVPIVNKLNPATVITDALYSLNIYDTHDQFFTCIAILAVTIVILCTLSYLMIRRESYASI